MQKVSTQNPVVRGGQVKVSVDEGQRAGAGNGRHSMWQVGLRGMPKSSFNAAENLHALSLHLKLSAILEGEFQSLLEADADYLVEVPGEIAEGGWDEWLPQTIAEVINRVVASIIADVKPTVIDGPQVDVQDPRVRSIESFIGENYAALFSRP